MNTPTVLVTKNTITIKFPGRPAANWHKSQEGFNRIAGLVLLKNWGELGQECDPAAKAAGLGLRLKEDTLLETAGGRETPAHPAKSKHLRAHPEKTLKAFQTQCRKNPEARAVDELLDFLNHSGLPLTPRGTFLGWKSIRADYMDHHTGKVRNKPGDKPQMPRGNCDPDRARGCSSGFHVGTLDYAERFHPETSRLVICEVDPANVTSVPEDESFQKLRCCKYKVIAEVKHKRTGRNQEEGVGIIEALAKTAPRKGAHKKILKPKHKQGPKRHPGTTKKAVLAYALGLKKSKKGDGYAAKMIAAKYPKTGLGALRKMVRNPSNPSRLNQNQKVTLTAILKAAK